MIAPPESTTVGLLLLAAGESRRMGRPKQLLPFAGTTLLRHACRTALATPWRPVVVVLGFENAACAAEISDLPVALVLNPQWPEGMGGSLRVGLARLLELSPETAGVLVLLPDQPLVEAGDLTNLMAAWDPPRRPVAAAAYNGVLGVPAVFARALFEELASLQGPAGARAVIARHPAEIAIVPMPAGAQDVDTPEDYRRIAGSDYQARADENLG
jgi:molybdenum cofactor cytidylyltransferase